jgi:hypothetical protein
VTARVELTIRYGEWGEQSKTVVVPIARSLERELLGSVELSTDPMSMLLASPGLMGGKGSAIAIRAKAFTMRRDVAEMIGRAIVPELMKAFGVNDEIDGYRKSDMTREQLEHMRMRGRYTEGE